MTVKPAQITDVSTTSKDGQTLFAVASERRTEMGIWVPDEIMHIHAFSRENALATYWNSVPSFLHKSRRVVSVGYSIGGEVLDEHGDRIIL